jgi:predicted dehydrogenase
MSFAFPEPRPFADPAALRWGVAAPGGIAQRFVQAVQDHTSQEFVAVGSRSRERARQFADAHGIPRAFGSFDELLDDTEVDVVYIASPHNVHAEMAVRALEAGKHVLVEKPFATTADEARAVASAARSAGVLAMEAMWTRYLPQADVVRQLLEHEVIGTVSLVSADFGFSLPYDPDHRIYAPALAGGALLDAGIYPISFVSSVLGRPTSMTVTGTLAPSGVENQVALTLDYGSAHASVLTSTRSALPVRATIMGSEGVIDIDAPFIAASGVTLSRRRSWRREQDPDVWSGSTRPGVYSGMSYEAEALASFVAAGLTESPIHPLDETITILELIDDARRRLGAGAVGQ